MRIGSISLPSSPRSFREKELTLISKDRIVEQNITELPPLPLSDNEDNEDNQINKIDG